MALEVVVWAAGPRGLYRPVVSVLVLASDIGAVALFGCTLGMWLTRTRVVVPPSPAAPGWRTAIVRWLVATGPAVAGYLAWITRTTLPRSVRLVLGVIGLPWMIVVFAPILFDTYLRGLHDRAAGTVVVLTRYEGSLALPETTPRQSRPT